MVSKKVTYISDAAETTVGMMGLGWSGGLEELFEDYAEDGRRACGEGCRLKLTEGPFEMMLNCTPQVFNTEQAAVDREKTCHQSHIIAARGITNFIDYAMSEQEASRAEHETLCEQLAAMPTVDQQG